MPRWFPSLCFRRFRNKHTELNRLHWTHLLGADALRATLSQADPNEYAVNAVKANFSVGMFPLKSGETLDWLDTYIARTRLHLLIITAANLEAYLQAITFYFLLAKGYTKESDQLALSDVGKALGAPILSKDSLPEPLKYAEKLFSIDYGEHLKKWLRAYKLRSVAAHDGGIVTPRVLKEIPDLKLPLDTIIGLDWDELKDLLASAEAIATITDQAISSYAIKLIEVTNLIIELKQNRQLPKFKPRNTLWQYLDDRYGIRGIAHEDRPKIQRIVFA